jgi:hypothetical protein
MSDRSHIPPLNGTKPGSKAERIDLSELKAHKEMHEAGPGVNAPMVANEANAALDLSAASIQSAAVQRLANMRERKIPGPPPMSAGRKISAGLERAMNSRQSASSETPKGIFNNPHYPYRGNIIARFIAFIANILKVLEQFVLSALSGRRKGPMPRAVAKTVIPEVTVQQPVRSKPAKRKWFLLLGRGN